MTRKTLMLGLSAAALVSAAAIGGAALAANPVNTHDDERGEIAAVTAAPVSLVQAVSLAEQQSGGKAMEASFDDESGNLWEVETVANGRVQTYTVNMTSGAISAQAAEADDNEAADDND